MTLEQIIEDECKKNKSSWFHKDDIKPLLIKYLKSLTEQELKQLWQQHN